MAGVNVELGRLNSGGPTSGSMWDVRSGRQTSHGTLGDVPNTRGEENRGRPDMGEF